MTYSPTFRRRFTGMLAAAAIALAGYGAASAPARAQDADDLFRFLLGAATIAIIISAFDERNVQFDRPYTGRILPDQCLETYRVRGRNIEVYNQRCLSRAGMRNLPAHCETRVRTDRGPRTVLGAQCLYSAGYRAEARWDRPTRPVQPSRPDRRMTLPNDCSLTYRDRGRRMTGYYADCLRDAGLRNLPSQCRLTARLNNQRVTIYAGQCLLDAGYREERRRR